jgi:hypothetical protein
LFSGLLETHIATMSDVSWDDLDDELKAEIDAMRPRTWPLINHYDAAGHRVSSDFLRSVTVVFPTPADGATFLGHRELRGNASSACPLRTDMRRRPWG